MRPLEDKDAIFVSLNKRWDVYEFNLSRCWIFFFIIASCVTLQSFELLSAFLLAVLSFFFYLRLVWVLAQGILVKRKLSALIKIVCERYEFLLCSNQPSVIFLLLFHEWKILVWIHGLVLVVRVKCLISWLWKNMEMNPMTSLA